MTNISEQQHKLLVEGLQYLMEIMRRESPENNVEDMEKSLNTLLTTYQKYEQLIDQLTTMINQYKKLHHKVRTETLAPALRELKKVNNQDSPSYFLIRELLINIRKFK